MKPLLIGAKRTLWINMAPIDEAAQLKLYPRQSNCAVGRMARGRIIRSCSAADDDKDRANAII